MYTLNLNFSQALDHEHFSGLTQLPGSYKLVTLYPGGSHLWYIMYDEAGEILFSGFDFKPSPLHCIDAIQSIIDLLGFLTLQLGDTDSEYFANYTPAQLAFAESTICDEIKLLVSDYECGNSYAIDYFNDMYTQDLSVISERLNLA